MSYVVRCAVRRCGGRRWRPTCSPRLGLFCLDGSNDWEDSFIHSSWSIHKPGSTYTFLTQTSDCHRVQSGSKAVAKSPTSWQRICGRNWRVRGRAKSAGRGCVGGWLRNGNNRALLLYKRIWIWIKHCKTENVICSTVVRIDEDFVEGGSQLTIASEGKLGCKETPVILPPPIPYLNSDIL